MKLHLPKGLRAALIAAFAVAGTLAQAGITTYDVTSWASYNPTAGAAVVGNGIAQTFDYTQDFNTNWNFVVTVNAASIQNDSALTLLALSLQQSGGTGLAEGITLADNGTPTATLTSWSSAAAGGAQTLDLTDVTTLTFVLTRTEDKNLTMKVYADDNFSSAIATATQGGQSFSGTKVDHVALGGTGGMSRYNHSANQVIFPADTGTGTFEITKAGYLFNSVVSENDLIKYYTPPSILEWHGTESATWDLSTANWVPQGETTPVVFADYASAVFGSGSSLVKSVEVEGSVNVDVMTVQDNYTFTAGSGSALMMDTLNVAAGKTVTLAGEGYFDITHLGGNISIAAEATVDLGDIITLSATQPLPVSGEGRLGLSTLKVEGGEHTITNALEVMGGGDGTGSTNRSLGLAVTNAAATITLLGDTHITGALYAQVGTVNIGNGTDAVRVETNRVEFGDTGGSGTSTLNVNKNATLHVRAGDVPNAYASTGLVMGEWGGVSVANVYGKLYADNATAYVGDNTVTFNIQEGGLMAVKGFSQNQHKDAKTETINLNLLDGGTVVLGDNGIASQKPINVSFAAGEVGISGFDVEIAKDVTLSGSGTTFNTTVYEWQGTDNTLELVLGEDIGAITVSGNITGDGAIIKTGGGALVLAGDANVITHTITLQEGELVLWGAYDVSALAGGSEEDYVDGEVEGNGFLSHGELIAHVVDIAADTSLSSDGIFTVNGAEGEFDTATGNATFGSGTSYTTLYVNVASTAEGLAHAMETAAAQGAQIGDVRLANNTTLNMNSAAAVLPLLTVAADADAAVNVTESAAITKVTGASEGHSLTINGTDGTMLTIGTAATDSFVSTGNLVINEGSTVLLQGNNTNFSGNVVVNGTLKVGSGSKADIGTNVFGTDNIAATSTRTITINSTGVLDLNGYPDTKYAYVLAGGKITNSGQDIGEGKAQMSGLKLTGDSTVEAGNGHEFWLLSASYAANTAELQGHTLVKTGDGRFGFKTSSITEGTLEAREGIIHFSGSNTVANMLLSGGTFTGGVDVKGDITVHATVGADMSAALNIAEAGKVITFDVDADQTLNQTGMVNGAGSIVKNGDGILVMSGAAGATTPGTLTGVQVNAGTLKVTAANVLGSGPITVAEDATLDMTAGNALAGTQTVTSSGNVIIHSTLISGTVNGGSLILAGDFPTTGELLDVGGLDTGNGFSQGGTIQVFDPTKAALDVTEIKHGDTTYHMDNLEAGAITLSGADWSIYQLNGAAQYAVQAIMDYAAEHSGTLAHIMVNADDLALTNDSTTLKSSVLGGEHLASFSLNMADASALEIDGDCQASIYTVGEGSSTINLTADATIGTVVAGDADAMAASTLTITGKDHTVLVDGLGVAFDSHLVIEEGVKVELLHDTSFTTIGNATVALKEGSSLVLNEVSFATVEGGTEATIKVTSNEYLPMYDPSFAEYGITGARITLDTTANFDMGHVIDATSQVVNAGTGTMRDISTNEKYAELNAQGGDIYISTPADSGTDTRELTVGNLTLAAGRLVGEDTGKAVSITVSGEASFGSGARVSSALTMAGGSTLDADGPVAMGTHALAIESGVTIGDDLWSTLSGLTSLESTNLFTGVSALTLAGEEFTEEVDLNSIFDHTSLKDRKFKLGYKDGNVIVTKLADNNRYWQGGDGTWDYTNETMWKDDDDTAAKFSSGYNAYFTGATNGTVTLGTDITADSITVSGADYTFEPNDHTLTVTKSVEADGHKATFNMALNGENLKLVAKNGGTITLNNGGSVKDVEVGANSTIRTPEALTVSGGFSNAGKLVQADTLTIQKGTEAGGNVTASTLNLTSGQSYTFGNLKAGTINGTEASLTIGGANTLTVDTNAAVASLTLGDDATVAGSGTVNTAGVTLQGDATVSGNLAVSGMIAGTGSTLTIAGGKLSAAMLGNGVNLATSGTTTITSTALRIALNGTVDNTATGTVTFVGSFDVGKCTTVDGTATYVGGDSTANGFKQAQKIVSVIDEGTADGTGATLTYNGTAIGQMGTNGKVTFQGDTEYDKFYVNSGSEKASKALDNPSQDLGTFELAAGTTLVVDKNISMGMVNTAGAATMQIDAGSTVTTDGTAKNLTLTGAGTLAVDAGKTSTGVTLGGTWAGTVSFTEAQLASLGGAWKSGSTVSLTGVTGTLGSNLIEGKVVLNKGTGDWGFGQTETSGTQYTNLENTLTGDGNLGVKSGSVDSTFNLNGNIDGWTGNFIVATDAETDLNLGGSGTKTVHGTVSGSNLTVNVQADTTFEGALNVDVINVDNTKAATLKADSTARWVDAYNGTLKVNDGKTLTVTDTAGPEGLKLGAGARIVLPGAAYLGGEDYGYVGGTVANGTSGDQAVGIHNTNITVTDTTLRVNGGPGFTVDNKLVNATLAVENGLPSTVTLNNVQDSLEVAGDLEIGPGGSLKVANGSYKQTLNISGGTTLTLANDTTLDADLTLNRGATLKLDYNMGSPVATTLNGGGLTLYKGLTLSGDLFETLKGLSTEGEYVTLFSNVDTIVFDGATTATVDASTYFTNLLDLEGDYTFNYGDGLLSIVYSESSSRQLVWDGTDAEHRWVAYEPEAIAPEVKDWYQPSTSEETHFVQGDTATFGSDADVKVVNLSAGETVAKMVTIKEAADYEFVADAAGSKLSATRFEVKEGATLNKSGTGTLILEVGENVIVDTAGFFVDEGELVIGTAEMPGTLALDNGVMEVAEDATLRVAKIQDSEGSLIAVCGTLNVASGSLHAIHALEGSTLVISNVNGVASGTLTIGSDTTLHSLENHGTLDVGTHSLTLAEAAAQGGNVTAGTLNLAQNGNAFGNLKVNTIHYAYGAEGAGELGAVNVDTIAANGGFPVITLDLTDTMGTGGSLAPTQRTGEATTYTLIHADGQTLSTSNFMLGGNTLALLVQNGLIHEGAGLETDGSNITLTIGGQDVTWNTDKDVTEWGYTVLSGDHITDGGDTFNGVEHLVVDASRRIDVTGAGSAPGLRVRNITGLDGRTITFTGTEDDTVNLVTNEETASNVNVAAENITLKVGLDKLDEMDPVDYKDLRVGNVNLTSATLDVHAHEGLDDAFTVNSLNGDSGSVLKGTLIVEGQGGAYNGGYEDATVILHEAADQTLDADRGLTVTGLGLARITYSGTETHMDGIEGIGLRVMLNDAGTDNSHRTLTLDNEHSYIVNGALGVGLSAIESGITLDSEAAPDLLRAEHLDMSGSRLYIYQAGDEGTRVMDVNDGGYKRGLLLAMLGGDDTTAEAVELQGNLFFKYYQNPRLENGRVLVDRRTDYFTRITEPTSENGQAGAGMLDDALLYNNPQATQQGGDLATVMSALEQGGYSHAHADKVMAAMSGASQAAMGAAWNRDVDRQLRAIRNRTTQMGLAECTRHEGLPYFNAWINAEGDYAKLGADGTLAGYKLTSWGGTLGVDVDFTNRFTMGVAVTAMSGNFTADSAERAEGDLDRLYVSLFGRYTRRAWTHTFVATLGMADTKLERTVDYGYGSYNANSDSDGKAFGLMYEVGYVTALNEDSSSCLQPVLNLSYRHSSLAGSGEQSDSDAALRLGEAEANVFTAAIGARLQSAVGTSVYNRSSIFEGRVMLKFDTGDRDVAASNSFVGVPGGRDAKSTEAGLFGVEVGAGLTIPLSENAGAIFFDVTGDFRAKDTEVNGTVGYRYNF